MTNPISDNRPEHVHGGRKGVTHTEWARIYNRLQDIRTLCHDSFVRGAWGEDEQVLYDVLNALATARARVAKRMAS